jgi:hypothetical protein
MKQHQILNQKFTLNGQACFCLEVKTDRKLSVQGVHYLPLNRGGELPKSWQDKSRWLYLSAAELKKVAVDSGLGMAYTAASQACTSLDTVVPDSMGYELHAALDKLRLEVGDVDEYVCEKLGYTHVELCRSLAAEQVDAVALAIHNIEQRRQGIIVGDQTGIGKGRIAAAMLRYATLTGVQPFFITEKPNLFSDIYRDLLAIGSGHLVPFIVNDKDSKTTVKDEQGNTLYEALPAHEQNRIFDDQHLPSAYDLILATYSQFASNKPTKKQAFLASMARGNILVLDEAHNAGGNIEASATADFFYKTVQNASGVVFLSATFAKRPDNMPLYAVKTCVSEANMTSTNLISAIEKGGVAMQEIIAANLVEEGQMIRRERSFDGIEVSYITLDANGARDFGVEDKGAEHWATADSITEVLRDIIAFQSEHIMPLIEDMDAVYAAENKEIKERGGTSKLGVDTQPFFSKLFRVVDQMLFALKCKPVAELAIRYLNEGKKPVIAFSSTMGAFIEQLEDDRGNPVSEGSVVDTDFAEVLRRGLDGVMRYSEVAAEGDFSKKVFSLEQLSPEAQAEYRRLREKIRATATGLHISPIDVVKETVAAAGYSVAEVTGRKLELREQGGRGKAVVYNRKKENVNDAFRKFNNNTVDCLLINQSGSTGASAHAVTTERVAQENVKQRVMIMLQAELDINREVQKRGRVNRTGQIYKPKYAYVTSPVPAERRLMMMLQAKLKSLDANTTSNQKNSKALLQTDDFLNKYGDKVVYGYLEENPELNALLGDPCGIADEEKDSSAEDAARKTTGRVAVLPCAEQQAFYNEIVERYKSYVDYLQQVGDYDLEVETMNLEAETLQSDVVVVGKGGSSKFGGDTFLEKCLCNVLKKPFTSAELQTLLSKGVGGIEVLADYEAFIVGKEAQLLRESAERYERLIREIPLEPNYPPAPPAQNAYRREREAVLRAAAEKNQALIKERVQNEKSNLLGFFKFFHVGRVLKFPVQDVSANVSRAVFVGVKVDKSRSNPYAPSAVKLCFALADSHKYFELVLSGEQGAKVQQVMGASQHLSAEELKLVESWERVTKEATVSRRVRYLVTGNILQGFSEYRGKLISYTTVDGQTKKGILMPENWEAHIATQRIKLPIKYAQKVIAGLANGSLLTESGLSFMRKGEGYRVATGGLSMQKYGSLIKNERILKLMGTRDGFQKVSSSWVGVFPEKALPELLDILQETGDSVLLSASQYEQVKDSLPKAPQKEERAAPPAKASVAPAPSASIDSDRERRIRIVKAKAIAKKKMLDLLELPMAAGI